MKTAANTPVQPPEDAFWQRYSPHHEFPLSCAGSFVIHAAVIGLLIISGLSIWAVRTEANRPAAMDVVLLADSGNGLGGFGGLPGLPGVGGPRTELVPQQAKSAEQKANRGDSPPLLQDVPTRQFALPDVPIGPKPPDDDILGELARLAKQAEENAGKKSAPEPKQPAFRDGVKDGTRNGTSQSNAKGATASGDGGQGGQGLPGGPGGSPRKLSKREIYARRWHFELSGNARQHAEKLIAAGVVVVIPDPSGRYYLRIEDLKRRPVELKPMALPKPEEAVQWRNEDPKHHASRASLAQELRLSYVPPFIVLLLPQSRESTMADVEAEFAERHGRDLKAVRFSQFDFEFRNGKYEPVIREQK